MNMIYNVLRSCNFLVVQWTLAGPRGQHSPRATARAVAAAALEHATASTTPWPQWV